MNEHSHPDRAARVVEQIDALTEDAASWSASGERARSGQTEPGPGSMTAIALTMTAPGRVELSESDPVPAIADLVGDPSVNRIRPLERVAFWIGDNSEANRPVNAGATHFLHSLLADVRDGNYAASDRERDRVGALLDSGDLPVIHGPSLVTGIAADGDTPAPLNEAFDSWHAHMLEELQRMLASLVRSIAREIGIPPDQLDRVAVAFLG